MVHVRSVPASAFDAAEMPDCYTDGQRSSDSNEANDKSRRSVAARLEMESRFWNDRISATPSIRVERYTGLDTEWLPSFATRIPRTM